MWSFSWHHYGAKHHPLYCPIAAMLLQPVLVGGMLSGCRAWGKAKSCASNTCLTVSAKHQRVGHAGLLSGIAYALVFVVIFLLLGSALGFAALGSLADDTSLAAASTLMGALLAGLVLWP